ncbi:MAG: hypothetical protein MUD07_00180 [Burkholderiaceae bacterium]|jgi:hypothetical protein|nr:hypothetical protein [Burkholderiaceae bacterium]
MAEPLTTKQSQILDRDKAAVTALLGEPVKIESWKTNEPPPDADAAAVSAFKAATLDAIWIYKEGRVHFSLDNIARKVDDKTRLDLEPPGGLVA